MRSFLEATAAPAPCNVKMGEKQGMREYARECVANQWTSPRSGLSSALPFFLLFGVLGVPCDAQKARKKSA
jgi:hypothetical protein